MTNSSKPSISKFVSDLVVELSSPLTIDEQKIAAKIKFLKQNKNEIEKHFATQAKRSQSKLAALSTTSISNEQWVRSVSLDYNLKPLSWGGSLVSATRFNNKGQPTIYLAEDDDTSLKEVRFSQHFNATTLFGVKASVQVILDLTDTANLSTLQISKKYFQAPWKSFNNVGIKYYTQFLTDHLRSLPIEGFLYESVQNPSKKCLCLFPEKMIKGSKLQIVGTYQTIQSSDLNFEGDA
jgi:RES domain-containing protein